MNVSYQSAYQAKENYIRYESVVLDCLPEKDRKVFLSQSTDSQFFIKNLTVNKVDLSMLEIKKNAQLYNCIVEKDLIVDGDLIANYCKLKAVKAKGKVNLYNCYQMDSIMADDDINLINEYVEKLFVKFVDTQKSAFVRNMHIKELTYRSGHTIVVDCDIPTIRIKKIKKEQTECILEFKGISRVEKIISEGVDIDIRGRKLLAR